MATLEERITALEQTTTEYRPVLQNIAYELTMVKGLTIDQVRITQQLRQDMSDVKERLSRIEELRQDMSDVKERLSRIEEQLGTILALLKPS